jgi:hypothetical protein
MCFLVLVCYCDGVLYCGKYSNPHICLIKMYFIPHINIFTSPFFFAFRLLFYDFGAFTVFPHFPHFRFTGSSVPKDVNAVYVIKNVNKIVSMYLHCVFICFLSF